MNVAEDDGEGASDAVGVKQVTSCNRRMAMTSVRRRAVATVAASTSYGEKDRDECLSTALSTGSDTLNTIRGFFDRSEKSNLCIFWYHISEETGVS